MSRYQMVECYMIMGGVPFYWSLLKKELSMAQNIDTLFFNPDAEGLTHEYDQLYASLFTHPEPYMQIVEALANKNKGLTRDEIIRNSGVPTGGDLTRYLDDLEWCGFIRKYNCLGKQSNDAIYQLMDNFTLFYFQYMKGNKYNDTHFWTNNLGSAMHRTWCGLAFERVCLQHIEQMKKALGISGVLTNVFSWQTEADADKGIEKSQIDLLIDRKDNVINLCEMKFSEQEYLMTELEATNLRRRKGNFIEATQTRKAVHITLVTPYGAKQNAHTAIIQNQITLDELFNS